MFGKAVLCWLSVHFYTVAAQAECTDLRGRVISHGLHYVPGPDTCTLCICDNGLPKFCKAVLCSPPQDCRSFRVGNTCCEFICLDDVVKPVETAEANFRVAAGGAAAVVLLTVALVVYRVRRQKRRRPPHADDQRSLTSIGYISGSMGYMGSTCETSVGAWKPHGNYLPRGEAPPPYDEAVAQCRGTSPPYHRTYPATVEGLTRPEDVMPCAGHGHGHVGHAGYANIPRPVQQMANPQNCYNAPLLQPVLAPDNRDPNQMPHHPLPPNMMGFPSAIRLTGSLGAISNRGLLSVLQRDVRDTRDPRDTRDARDREPEHERPHNVPGFYTNPNNLHASLHRTIPRISAAVDSPLLDGGVGGFGALGGLGGLGFSRAERSLQGEIRRSFHRPGDARHDTGRSIPRNLNIASVTDAADLTTFDGDDRSNLRLTNGGRSRAHSEEQNVGGAEGGTVSVGGAAKPPAPPPADPPLSAPPTTLPLTVDKPSCVCSYSTGDAGDAGRVGRAGGEGGEGGDGALDGEGGEGGEDGDDYRSECENCKSAGSSRWAVSETWEGPRATTQTLQRRAPAPATPPPATATLPQPVTKQSRSSQNGPSNWENWFNTIMDSDTESEEE